MLRETFSKQDDILVGFFSGFVLVDISREFLVWFCFKSYISAEKLSRCQDVFEWSRVE